MIAACHRAGVILGVGHVFRQHPLHREVRRLVAEGTLGDVLLARAHCFTPASYDRSGWKSEPEVSGGGAVMGFGVHQFDLLRFLLGQEVTEVAAFVDAKPIEEVVTCMLRFERGTLAYLDTSRILPFAAERNELLLYGAQARALVTGTLAVVSGFPSSRAPGRLEITTQVGTTVEETTPCDVLRLAIEEFGHCVRERSEPSATGLDGQRAVELTAALYVAARTGHVVNVANRL